MPTNNYAAKLGLDLFPYEGLDTTLWVELTKVYNAIQNLAKYTDSVSGVAPANLDNEDIPTAALFTLSRYTRLAFEAGEALQAGNIVQVGYFKEIGAPEGPTGDPMEVYKSRPVASPIAQFEVWKYGYVAADYAAGDIVEVYTCGVLKISGLTIGLKYGTHPSINGVLVAEPNYETELGIAIATNGLYFNPTF